MFNKLSNSVDGKKTYVVMAIAIVYAISGFVSGNLTVDQAIELIIGALGLGALRSGIRKLE